MRTDLRRPSVFLLVAGLTLAGLVAAGLARPRESNAAPAARPAGICSAGESGVQVQNLDPDQSATIVADFYDAKGNLALSVPRPNIPPFGSTTFWLPGIPGLANGAYAMIIRTDPPRRTGAINRTDWSACGGAAIYSNPEPDAEVLVPLVVRQPGRQVSLVGIQNTDTKAQANLTVEVYQPGNASPIRSLPLALPPAGSVALDLGLDPEFATLPPGFYGSMRIASTTKVAVQTFFDIENSAMAVSAFEGVPAGAAAERVFVPLFRNDYYGTTGISVVNPGASPVDVKVSYHGSSISAVPACRDQTFVHNNGQAVAIPARSSAVFYQGGMTAEAGPPGLPAGCFGSAEVAVQGAGKVLAVVNDFTTGAGGVPLTASAYNAIGASQGARKVAVPLWRIHHTAADLVSGIQAMNLSAAQAAQCTIKFIDSNGTELPGGADRTPSIPAGGSHTWYTPNVSGLMDRTNTYGSALIDCDQPMAVIVNEVSLAGKSDAVTYNGIGADAPALALTGAAQRRGAAEFMPAAVRSGGSQDEVAVR